MRAYSWMLCAEGCFECSDVLSLVLTVRERLCIFSNVTDLCISVCGSVLLAQAAQRGLRWARVWRTRALPMPKAMKAVARYSRCEVRSGQTQNHAPCWRATSTKSPRGSAPVRTRVSWGPLSVADFLHDFSGSDRRV